MSLFLPAKNILRKGFMGMRARLRFILTAAFFLAAGLMVFYQFLLFALPPAETLAGPAEVVDGDTLFVDGMTVRLFGIDAPESEQTCQRKDGEGKDRTDNGGLEAGEKLSGFISGDPVSCAVRADSDSESLTGVCSLGDTDLGRWMVSAGHALAFTRKSNEYQDEQNRGRNLRRGLWAGAFEFPWAWRLRKADGTGACRAVLSI